MAELRLSTNNNVLTSSWRQMAASSSEGGRRRQQQLRQHGRERCLMVVDTGCYWRHPITTSTSEERGEEVESWMSSDLHFLSSSISLTCCCTPTQYVGPYHPGAIYNLICIAMSLDRWSWHVQYISTVSKYWFWIICHSILNGLI